MIKNIFLASIPIFVTIDALGTLPIFVSLTQGLNKQQKKTILIESFWTALGLASFFIFLGKLIFNFLGITMGDFMIAGGLVLFCIAITDLLKPGKESSPPPDQLGVFPLGTPLMVGPAVLTTSLVVIDQYGIMTTVISLFLNILLAVTVFSCSDFLIKILGKAGSRALSKIMALLLAAIAVMMIRKGVFEILGL